MATGFSTTLFMPMSKSDVYITFKKFPHFTTYLLRKINQTNIQKKDEEACYIFVVYKMLNFAKSVTSKTSSSFSGKKMREIAKKNNSAAIAIVMQFSISLRKYVESCITTSLSIGNKHAHLKVCCCVSFEP